MRVDSLVYPILVRAALVLAIGVSSPASFAQATSFAFDAQTHRPSVDADGALWVDDSGDVTPGWGGSTRVFGQWAKAPLVRADVDGARVATIDDVASLELAGAARYGRVRVGAYVPVYLGVTSDDDLGGGGLGDAALDARVTLVDRGRSPLGVAVSARAQAPTATTRAPLGGVGPQWEASLIADQRWSSVFFAFNLGYRGVGADDDAPAWWRDQLVLRAGAGWQPAATAGVAVEAQARTPWSGLGRDPLGEGPQSLRGLGAPAELLVSGWHAPGGAVRLIGGVSTAISGGVGAPVARVMVGLAVGEAPRVPIAAQP